MVSYHNRSPLFYHRWVLCHDDVSYFLVRIHDTILIIMEELSIPRPIFVTLSEEGKNYTHTAYRII